MRVVLVWLDSYALTAGQRTSSSTDGQVLILAGMAAELASTMEESCQAMILMLGDVMSVGDRSGQVGAIEGISWSEDCAVPSGVRREGPYECRCSISLC